MLCKGGCGHVAIFNNGWCSKPWNKCRGFKKKLSELAKLRGNYRIKGKLSKKYGPEDFIKKEYFFNCKECGVKFSLFVKSVWFKQDNRFRCLCIECTNKYRAENIKNMCMRRYLQKLHNNEWHLLPYYFRKEFLFNEQGKKCSRCNYNLYDSLKGPYQIHHKDGNNDNHSKENEEVMCANCHMMTDNFAGRSCNKNKNKLIGV